MPAESNFGSTLYFLIFLEAALLVLIDFKKIKILKAVYCFAVSFAQASLADFAMASMLG